MRESEEWVLNAEKYASLAWLDGRDYPTTELTDAWKHVLFNQFHDLAAGSGIGIIYKDAQKDYNQVHWATNEITSKSLDTIQAHGEHARAGGQVPVMVVNPLGWDRSGVVEAKVEMPSAVAEGNFDCGCQGSRAAVAGGRERQEDQYVSLCCSVQRTCRRSAMRCCMRCPGQAACCLGREGRGA